MNKAVGTTLAYVTEENELIVLDKKLFSVLCIEYITAAEYANKFNKNKSIILRYLREGRIEGAYNSSGIWLIPKDAPYPEHL